MNRQINRVGKPAGQQTDSPANAQMVKRQVDKQAEKQNINGCTAINSHIEDAEPVTTSSRARFSSSEIMYNRRVTCLTNPENCTLLSKNPKILSDFPLEWSRRAEMQKIKENISIALTVFW